MYMFKNAFFILYTIEKTQYFDGHKKYKGCLLREIQILEKLLTFTNFFLTFLFANCIAASPFFYFDRT